ncbi:unnamed protein product [Periconia digitata]|uniref:Uncharacterized protein n=1 Tax=Periconia digitata TaxID=1303443 RepID=A0A9W4UN91_9PLEO|nr:unnamed protein product [Periconia digitata]
MLSVLEARGLVPFTPSDINKTQTIINGVTFSLDALREFKYELYSNHTISNESNCYLAFDRFKPWMMDNGTWVGETNCYIPYYGIGTRGKASIAFGVAFGLTIMFTLVNLNKHGRLYIREDKRFRAVGRRWQWYWMLFTAACGMISTLTGVDIDRFYVQQLPIILQCFFFMLMIPGVLAMVWEAVRHWGSWQERQIVDADPYGMPQDDRRSKFEFWIPLVFYLFAWIEFFMTIPRSWTAIQKQDSPEQTELIARPAATNTRGKAGAVMAALAWLVICVSLYHSMHHYKSTPPGIFGKIASTARNCPWHLLAVILILAVRVAYGLAAAWIWDLSVFQKDVHIGWPFGLGYGSILLVIVVFEIAGFLQENEDKQLIAQRIARGRVQDAELNLVRKPNWWNRHMANRFASEEQRLREMTREVGGGGGGGGGGEEGGRGSMRATSGADVEMNDLNMKIRNRSTSRPPNDPFRDESPPRGRGGTGRVESETASVRTERTDLTGQTLGGGGSHAGAESRAGVPQQRIRSMLDV